MTPDIEEAPLSAMPPVKPYRASSLVSFIQRSDHNNRGTTSENVAMSPPCDKIRALSQKTGLSVETLKQVKSLETQI